MVIAHNGMCTLQCNLLTDIRIARETGYDGIEIIGAKLYRYLDQGFGVETVVDALAGFPVVGLGFVQDIERQAPEDYEALIQETEKMCSLAQQVGAPMVQLLTGPISSGVEASTIYQQLGYQGLAGRMWPEVRDLTAKNLRAISGIGKKYDVTFYLEPLSWTPLHTLTQTLELLDCADVDNVALLIDFWHQWTSGTAPDDVAKLDKGLIAAVHFCDSLPVKGGVVTQELRDVWTGAGHIPLQEWVDAVKATGFDGWVAGELFSSKHLEIDPWRVAGFLAEMMRLALL